MLTIDNIGAAAFRFFELCKPEQFYRVRFDMAPNLDAPAMEAQADRADRTVLLAFRPT